MELKIEEDFLDLATKLVMDEKWGRYNERWLSLQDNLKRSELLAVFQLFSKEYCQLLGRAVMQYAHLRTRSMLPRTKSKNIRWPEIVNAAFKFVGRFTTRKYQTPWVGTFVLPRRPTDSRPQGPMPEDDAWMDFQQIQTAWFDKNGKVGHEELLGNFSQEVQSGAWRSQVSARAVNEFQLNLSLNPADRQAAPNQRQDLTRAIIARAKRDNPGASIESLCKVLDAKCCPLPDAWKNSEFKTWHAIWKSLQDRNKVKRYIAGVLPAFHKRKQRFVH